MADRFSARIEIGGDFPRALLPDFFEHIEGYTDWNEGPSPETEKELLECVENQCLELTDQEARNGEFEGLELWLQENDIPFNRYSGAYDGYSAEMEWYRPGMEKPDDALLDSQSNFIIGQSAVEEVLKILSTNWNHKLRVEYARKLLEKLIVKVPDLPVFRIV